MPPLSVYLTLLWVSLLILISVVKSQSIPHNYNPYELPQSEGLVVVNISVEINDIVSVDESNQSFKVDFTLTRKWKDIRLNISTCNSDYVLLDNKLASQLWTPSIILQNAIETSAVEVNQKVEYMIVDRNNYITHTIRMLGNFVCHMDLTYYPQDFQHCSIEVVSFTNSINVVELEWDHYSAIDDGMPNFYLKTYSKGYCKAKYNQFGQFSCLSATIEVSRLIGYYVIRVYGPTFLVVINSFSGFWMPILPFGWPAKATILVTPILAVVNQDVYITNDVEVSYITALNYWMIGCNLFVFATLVEYAVAISWAYNISDMEAIRSRSEGDIDLTKISYAYFDMNSWFNTCGQYIDKVLYIFYGHVDYKKQPFIVNKVHLVSRILFSFLYMLFIIIYVLVTVIPWARS